jgi:hypothetical protein
MPTRFIDKGIAPNANPARTLPRYSALASSIPKKSDLLIKVPKAKNENAAGTETIATSRSACLISDRISSRFSSRTNLESLGRIAVTIEIVAIECGNIKIRYAFA